MSTRVMSCPLVSGEGEGEGEGEGVMSCHVLSCHVTADSCRALGRNLARNSGRIKYVLEGLCLENVVFGFALAPTDVVVQEQARSLDMVGGERDE